MSVSVEGGQAVPLPRRGRIPTQPSARAGQPHQKKRRPPGFIGLFGSPPRHIMSGQSSTRSETFRKWVHRCFHHASYGKVHGGFSLLGLSFGRAINPGSTKRRVGSCRNEARRFRVDQLVDFIWGPDTIFRRRPMLARRFEPLTTRLCALQGNFNISSCPLGFISALAMSGFPQEYQNR